MDMKEVALNLSGLQQLRHRPRQRQSAVIPCNPFEEVHIPPANLLPFWEAGDKLTDQG